MFKPKSSGNIVDYVRQQGDNNFWRLPFNEVDSLVLATMCYAELVQTPFGKINNFNCTIGELNDLVDAQNISRLMWSRKRGIDLLHQAGKSHRFGSVLIHDFCRRISTNQQKQFTAMTFTLNTDLGYIDYIGFQGTDDTLIGWKEDFNMSFTTPIPSQIEAVRYINHIASQSDNLLIIGGHSKGGNLAVYGGLKSSAKIRNRIIAIYDHDGPGFLPGTFTADDKRHMSKRIHKTVPEGALVGLLMEDQLKKYTVVKSDAHSVFQHDSLTWQVNGTKLVAADNVNRTARYTRRVISRWLSQLPMEQRRQVIDQLFDILDESGQETIPGLRKYLAKNLSAIIKRIKSADPAVYTAVSNVIKLLAKSSWLEARSIWRQQVRND